MKLIPSIHTTQFLLDIHPLLELAVAGLLGGLLVGAAIGIALNHACATGGTDVIALLILPGWLCCDCLRCDYTECIDLRIQLPVSDGHHPDDQLCDKA